jgi:hypothetical protein
MPANRAGVKPYMGRLTNTLDDFWARIDTSGGPETCHPWIGRRVRGYGHIMLHRKTRLAHRVAYTLTYGAIPTGYVVMHDCDNPACCNPKHLRTGTQAENVADRDRKGRRTAPRGSAHPMARFTEEHVHWMRQLYARGWSQTRIARQFNTHQAHVSRIVRGKAHA